jgi:peptidoglycan/LPS O-acetylase OafA/YrhL
LRSWHELCLARFKQKLSWSLSYESQQKRFLDALRGIAAMSVVIFHLVEGHHVDLFLAKSPIWLVVMLEHGNLGVSIFFVLSGFVFAPRFTARM